MPQYAGVDFLGANVGLPQTRVSTKNAKRFRDRIEIAITRTKPFPTSEETLGAIIRRVNYKVRGPTPRQMQKLIDAGTVDHPYRRCWIGFFRFVSDEDQIRSFDRWIRGQISKSMWERHRERVKFKHMKAAGLKSLVRAMYRARRLVNPT